MSGKVPVSHQDEGGKLLLAFQVSARVVVSPVLTPRTWAITAITAITAAIVVAVITAGPHGPNLLN
ncbi:hypothetical protein [Streptomyces cyaneofuscatus]|uniref:hypothetical protein n=1 Tax=Streptomyces cyaneofuscatus TaxID=66883 RepID=UPI0033BAE5B7